MSNIAIFASGTGTNARKIIHYFSRTESPVNVKLIVSNKEDSGVIDFAKTNNISFQIVNDKSLNSSDFINYLKEIDIEWIVLAGFLRKIPSEFIANYKDRIINLHPSLLPKYGGKGMYGKNVHKAVIENKETESGITIHLVNEEFDKGKIIFQTSCEVLESDDTDTLAKRIQKLEHDFFPSIIKKQIINSRV